MPSFPPIRPRLPIRVVLSSTALLPFTSLWRASAMAIAELGFVVFLVSGVTAPLGGSAVWFVLAAAVAATFVRAIDIESWGLLVPGGFVGSITQALGTPAARVAAATSLVERLMFGGLAATLLGHYAVAAAVTVPASGRITGLLRSEDLANVIAAAAIGTLWARARLGRTPNRQAITQGIWIGVALLVTAIVWGVVTVIRSGDWAGWGVFAPPPPAGVTTQFALDSAVTWLLGFALVLPMLGASDLLARSAHEFAPPRIHALRRIGRVTVIFSAAVVLASFAFVVLVPEGDRSAWVSAPLAGIAAHLAGPPWLRGAVAIALGIAALLILLPAAQSALDDTDRTLQRWSTDGVLPSPLASLNTRFGMPARALDIAALLTVLTIVVSGGRVAWLAHGYGVMVAAMLVLKIAGLIRLRHRHQDPRPYTAPLNVRLGRRELPLGLIIVGTAAAAAALAFLAVGDVAALSAVAVAVSLSFWFVVRSRRAARAAAVDEAETFDLLPSVDLSLDQIQVRPGKLNNLHQQQLLQLPPKK